MSWSSDLCMRGLHVLEVRPDGRRRCRECRKLSERNTTRLLRLECSLCSCLFWDERAYLLHQLPDRCRTEGEMRRAGLRFRGRVWRLKRCRKCGRVALAQGGRLCRDHSNAYQRELRARNRRTKTPVRPCENPECSETVHLPSNKRFCSDKCAQVVRRRTGKKLGYVQPARKAVLTGMIPCSIDECPKSPVLARGWCSYHYQRWYKTGDPLGSWSEARR